MYSQFANRPLSADGRYIWVARTFGSLANIAILSARQKETGANRARIVSGFAMTRKPIVIVESRLRYLRVVSVDVGQKYGYLLCLRIAMKLAKTKSAASINIAPSENIGAGEAVGTTAGEIVALSFASLQAVADAALAPSPP